MTPIDVLVCGGGIAGTMAAVAAARAGAHTAILERSACLGGSATVAAVGQFVGWETASGRRVVQGLAEEIVERLTAIGGARGHGRFIMSTGHSMDRVEYDPELLKLVLDTLVGEAGVEVLFHATLAGVGRQGRVLTQVEAATKAGPLILDPKLVIDASGDLDLSARAGTRFLPLDPAERLQPATLMFRMGPIDFGRFDTLPVDEIAALAERGVASGALARAALHVSRIPGTADGWFNVTRVAVDATDPFALSQAEMEGRRQAVTAAAYITQVVPGCEQARLVALAPQIGIRETRRIAGAYVLTEDDLRLGTRFPDAIACGAYPIDLHPPQGAGLHIEAFAADHCYWVPYRALIPEGLDNVLVAGRGLSATHAAHAATRVMPLAMAIGQAAGTAAALLAAGNLATVELPGERLRAQLVADGAFLG
jgi:FAD dependent oxidoreductase